MGQVDILASFIADLLIAEKDMMMEALQNEDEEALADEIYYAFLDC